MALKYIIVNFTLHRCNNIYWHIYLHIGAVAAATEFVVAAPEITSHSSPLSRHDPSGVSGF